MKIEKSVKQREVVHFSDPVTYENHLCNILGVMKESCLVAGNVLASNYGTHTRASVHVAMRGTDSPSQLTN